MASLFSKALVYLGLVDEDQVDEDSYEVPIEEPRRVVEPPIPQGRRVEPPPTARAANRPFVRTPGTVDQAIPVEARSHVLLVEEFGDARILADRVRERVPVVLDMRASDPALVRRVIDFSSGLIYALDGTMRKVGDGLVLVLPPRMALSRDEKRRLTDLGVYELDDIDD